MLICLFSFNQCLLRLYSLKGLNNQYSVIKPNKFSVIFASDDFKFFSK